MNVFFSFTQDWFQVTLDKWVHSHKKLVPTGGDYVEKINPTLEIDV